MKFADEFRDPAAARGLVKSITELAGDGEYTFMGVCGGHTHTIYRHGLEHLLPPSIELARGPGCPVCVIPIGSCMVSPEGACAAYNFGRLDRETAALVGRPRAAAHD